MHEESYDIKVYFCQIFVDGDGLWVCGCLSVCLFLFLCLLLSLCESASFCPTRELKNVIFGQNRDELKSSRILGRDDFFITFLSRDVFVGLNVKSSWARKRDDFINHGPKTVTFFNELRSKTSRV